MLNINKKDLGELNKQQSKIIDSDSDKIVVHAGPGSGKTYTMVRMITKELEALDDYKAIIACSFTREASSQLEVKIKEKTTKHELSYIGTIDSFIMNEIILPYKNRLLNSLNLKYNKEQELSFSFPENKSEATILTKEGIKYSNKKERNEYCRNWILNLSKGKYEVSFPVYIWASWLIENNDGLSKYLEARYSTVYIDEAQDMNEYQHKFFEILIKKCNLRIVLIGDKNQSIYEFRGARPEYFYQLSNKGFSKYEITYSIRCHKNILDFSNLFINQNHNYKKTDDNRVKLNIRPCPNELIKTKENYFILCEDNKKANELYNYFIAQGVNVILSRPIEIGDKEFSDNYMHLIEEILKYKINLDNKDPKLVVSLLDFKETLGNYQVYDRINDQILIDETLSLVEFIEGVFNTINIYLPKNIKNNINEELSDDRVINHYKKRLNANRIMTIHGSKGLESEIVYVILNKPFIII